MLDPKEVFFAIPIKQIVEICGVDITTARRWKRGATCPPQHMLRYLSARYYEDLGFLDPDWRGWKLRRGNLISPEGWEMTMGDVLASRLHEAQLACWRLEVSKMRTQLTEAERQGYEDQPTPDCWDVQILVG
jgi:hypothetical protein